MTRTTFSKLSISVWPAVFGLLAATLSGQSTLPAYTITTIAGQPATAGSDGIYAGDGGPAINAQLNYPLGITLSGSTLFIADQDNQIVRAISLGSGIITAFAGNNTGGYTGDLGAATKAEILHPTGIGVGSAGVYIADSGNSVVRLVAPSGIITTVAGNTGSGAGYSGDAALATGAQYNLPTNVVVDSAGNYYIADTNNSRIRKVTLDGNVNTIAGGSQAEYLGDGGPATAALINHPLGMALDLAGNLYFADNLNHVIRKINVTTGIITTVVGNGTAGFSGDGGPAAKAQLNYPQAIAFDGAGNLYIADTLNQRIRVVLLDGTIHSIAGNGIPGYSGDNGPAQIAQLNFPRGIAVDALGNVYVSDTTNRIIRKLAPLSTQSVAPAVNPNGVITSSDFGPLSTASQGSWVEIYGSNLSLTTRVWNYSDFSGISAPISLDSVSVSVGGQPAYISYISPGQVNALISSNTPVGAQPLVVTAPSGTSAPYTITIKGTQPRLAAPASINVGGKQYAAAFLPDGTPVLPAVAPGRRPAVAGDVISLYGIGFGSLQSGAGAGQIISAVTPAGFFFSAPVKVAIGGVPANILYQGISPTILGPVAQTPYNTGLDQLNVQVPAGITPGDFVPLTFTLDGVPGTQTLYLAIGN